MDIDITEILRAIAEGKQNDMGDYWSPSWCKNAAEHIEALRARVSALEAELKAFREDVEGAERRTLSFAMACVRNVDGITAAGALEMQRDEIARLRAELKELGEQEPAGPCFYDYQNRLVLMPAYTRPAPQVPDGVARDAERYNWLRNGGWEVMQDPKYWAPERRFDGAIEAGMAEVKSDAMLSAAQSKEGKP